MKKTSSEMTPGTFLSSKKLHFYKAIFILSDSVESSKQKHSVLYIPLTFFAGTISYNEEQKEGGLCITNYT